MYSLCSHNPQTQSSPNAKLSKLSVQKYHLEIVSYEQIFWLNTDLVNWSGGLGVHILISSLRSGYEVVSFLEHWKGIVWELVPYSCVQGPVHIQPKRMI